MPNFDVTQLALLFFPGIISRIILGRLLFYKDESAFKYTLHAFVLGTLSYLILYSIKYLHNKYIGCIDADVDVEVVKFINSKKIIDFKEIIYATIISIPLALVISILETNKLLYKLCRTLRFTYRFSEPDVWGFALNSEILNKNDWITVRDKPNNLMYLGRLRAFSDSFKEAELFLSDVIVYNNTTGEELYQVYALYITLNHSTIEIQFYER